MEALASTAAKHSSNSMALGAMVLGKPAPLFKPLENLLHLVIGVSPEN
jgi:hypothetical protein